MTNKKIEFPITFYGKLNNYNDVLSIGRCRIFYKYGNRNGTYFTDEAADKLVATLPYTPIKGIYDGEDYGSHGLERSEGRIYGIVPEKNNFAWEKHLDEDGIEREYACTDVLLFTAIYSEAQDIIGKSQSMELFPPTLEYHQEIIHSQKYMVIDSGSFLGLQVLGDNTIPCFEGASFYSNIQNYDIDKIKTDITNIVNVIYDLAYNEEGRQSMSKINYRLSDDAKREALWTLLNTDYNEDGDWTIDYSIIDIYDDYALVFKYGSGPKRVKYTKDNELDSVKIDSIEDCYIMDVTISEKETLDTLRKLNGDSYESINSVLSDAQENFEKVSELDSKILEFKQENSTLNAEKEELQGTYEALRLEYDTLKEQSDSLTQQIDELQKYKLNIESQEKEAIFAKYSDQISEDILSKYREKIDSYTAKDLDKELAYEFIQSNAEVFTKHDPVIPKNTPKTGLEAILDKYKK